MLLDFGFAFLFEWLAGDTFLRRCLEVLHRSARHCVGWAQGKGVNVTRTLLSLRDDVSSTRAFCPETPCLPINTRLYFLFYFVREKFACLKFNRIYTHRMHTHHSGSSNVKWVSTEGLKSELMHCQCYSGVWLANEGFRTIKFVGVSFTTVKLKEPTTWICRFQFYNGIGGVKLRKRSFPLKRRSLFWPGQSVNKNPEADLKEERDRPTRADPWHSVIYLTSESSIRKPTWSLIAPQSE